MFSKTTIGPATKIGEQQTGSYMQVFLYRAAEKNNGAIAKNLKQFVPWFKECGARVEYNHLNESESQSVIHSAKENGMNGLDNLDKSLKRVGNEFLGLVTQEKRFITGRFGALKE
jgi:hypothetical protein